MACLSTRCLNLWGAWSLIPRASTHGRWAWRERWRNICPTAHAPKDRNAPTVDRKRWYTRKAVLSARPAAHPSAADTGPIIKRNMKVRSATPDLHVFGHAAAAYAAARFTVLIFLSNGKFGYSLDLFVFLPPQSK